MVDMISNHKLAPREIEKRIAKDLYDRLERRWQQVELVDKQIRIDTLVRVMLDLSQEQHDTFFGTLQEKIYSYVYQFFDTTK